MEATNPINPNALFMIKGADQSTLTTNGGQGFVTSQTIISESYSSNPNAFFRTLLSKSYSTQVTFLVHIPGETQDSMTFRQLSTLICMLDIATPSNHGFFASCKSFANGYLLHARALPAAVQSHTACVSH